MRTRAHLPHGLLRFSQRFECKFCNIRYEEPEPRLFSFNNPYGACPKCQGFGNTIDFDLDLVIPDKMKTLAEGAIDPWTKPKYRPLFTDLKRYAKQAGIPLDMAWIDMAEEHRNLVLNGEGKFLGVRGFFAHLERKKYKLHVRVFLSRYRGYSLCSSCLGSRLRLEARQVKINGRNICEICSLTVEDALKFFEQVELTQQETEIADRVLQEIRERLRFLNDVGLEYLTLDRLSSTLSGGEAQRIQLATSLGSRLVGTLYVLDEPSIGLHARDTHRLVKILHDLRDLGNTILVVEHDPDIMRAADCILDLGPGAGENGGKLIAEGTYDEILHNPSSLTGRYLSEDLRIQPPATRRKPGTQQIKMRGIRANNLKNVDINIPLNLLGGDHRSFGIGQIHAAASGVVSRLSAGQAAKRQRFDRLLHVCKLGEPRGRAIHRGSSPGRSIADRTDAALESRDVHQGIRRDPRTVRFPPRSQEARVRCGTFFLQHSRRPLRSLPGRRHGHGRNAVPRRR